MSIPEIISRIQQEKAAAIKNGAPIHYIHGLEAAVALIRISVREAS
jgi:hypothetical protein